MANSRNVPFRSLTKYHFALAALLPMAAMLYAPPVLAEQGWSSIGTRAFRDPNAIVRDIVGPYENIHIVVELKLRNKDALDTVVSAITAHRGAAKQRYLSTFDTQQEFAPTSSQAAAVAAYLKRSGFTGLRISQNNLLIEAFGHVSAVRTAFNTNLVHISRGKAYGIANVSDVQLPAELHDIVGAVVGLQTIGQVRPFVRLPRALRQPGPNTGPLDITPCPGCLHGSGTPSGIALPSLATYYGASGLATASKANVGIITEGSMTNVITDLQTFESSYGFPNFVPSVVYAGTQSSDTSAQVEFDLDSQTILGVSGGSLKSMTLYTAAAFTDADLDLAYNAAVSANMAKVINVSLGECETDAKSDGGIAAADPIFELAVAQGQTFTVATGDSGSDCPDTTTKGVAYPASSPYVIAVGGTALTTVNGAYGSETAWSGGGGGSSTIEPQPAWQNGIVSGTTRGLPDVAFDAAESSGVLVIYDGAAYGPIYGTSVAAPIFNGLMARFQSAAGNSLPFPAQWIYQFPITKRPSAFHDITSGSNGAYSAGVGWDYTTGFGSMNAINVASGFATIPIAPIASYLLHQASVHN